MSNTSKSSESTINILLNYAKLLYHNCIDKHIKDVNSFSLDVLFSPLILDEYKEYAREASARCLFSVFDYYLSEKSKSPDAIPYEEYRILFRIDLVIEILEKQDTKSFSLLETIKQNRGQIISSHSSLFSKYEAFKQSGDPFIEIIKEEYL